MVWDFGVIIFNVLFSQGEVTASLIGPFVGFHHQALLIACFWPAGRGNVGYGANVGSNHTGKAPDQENWPGEGTFFGLASNIKYPFNLVDAPYSLIATGVSCLPQAIGVGGCRMWRKCGMIGFSYHLVW